MDYYVVLFEYYHDPGPTVAGVFETQDEASSYACDLLRSRWHEDVPDEPTPGIVFRGANPDNVVGRVNIDDYAFCTISKSAYGGDDVPTRVAEEEAWFRKECITEALQRSDDRMAQARMDIARLVKNTLDIDLDPDDPRIAEDGRHVTLCGVTLTLFNMGKPILYFDDTVAQTRMSVHNRADFGNVLLGQGNRGETE